MLALHFLKGKKKKLKVIFIECTIQFRFGLG
jgi:hypothetical protein